jgi:hypothetical protein
MNEEELENIVENFLATIQRTCEKEGEQQEKFIQ